MVVDALKEWSVAVRALREGRQILLLRKGGILDPGGEFEVQARDVALFPTYLHEDEQTDALQPCYGAWRTEETRLRPKGEVVRIDAVARITDTVRVQSLDSLVALMSQHIYSEAFLRFRGESAPDRPLWALLLRTYNLPRPIVQALEPDHYGCRSWVKLTEPIDPEGAVPALSDHTYAERVRVTRRYLEHG